MPLKNKLDIYTKLSVEQRTKASKWLAKQNEELKLIAFEKQKDFLFKFTITEEKNKSILYLAAYCLAADILYRLLHKKKIKNKLLNIDNIDDSISIQVKQLKTQRESPKHDKLLNIKGKILKLIEVEKVSFREVSKFLKTYHRIEISHTYIATFYKSIKEEK